MVDHINCCRFDNRRLNLRIADQQIQMINQVLQNNTNQSGVCFNKNNWVANWINKKGAQKNVWFSVNRFGYEVAKRLAIAKRLEMELSLNHYHLALHSLLPLEPLKPQEPEVNYDFEEPEEPDEI